MAKVQNDVTGWYADTFKAWQAKLVGPKPANTSLDTIHKLNARPGKQALACAMAMRPDGVTGSEIIIACGAPQLNKMRGFITDGLLKREAAPPRNGHTVYKLTLTSKGATRVKGSEAKAAAKADKPAKVKKVTKPRKPKADKVTVAVPAAPVTDNMVQPQG